MTDFWGININTILILATLIFGGLVTWQYVKGRRDRQATAWNLDITGGAATAWEKLKDRVMRMSKYAVAFTALILFFLIPGGNNKVRYLGGVVFGLLFLGYLLPRLMAYNTFYAVNLKNQTVAVFDICNLMLPFYKIVDRDHEPAALEYSLFDRRGRAWVVDWVDLENRVIVVNPITSSVEFTKDYRKAYNAAVQDANHYLNRYNETKTKLDQKVDIMAVNILEQIGAWKDDAIKEAAKEADNDAE